MKLSSGQRFVFLEASPWRLSNSLYQSGRERILKGIEDMPLLSSSSPSHHTSISHFPISLGLGFFPAFLVFIFPCHALCKFKRSLEYLYPPTRSLYPPHCDLAAKSSFSLTLSTFLQIPLSLWLVPNMALLGLPSRSQGSSKSFV